MNNTIFLDSNVPISIEALQVVFQTNDFSTMVSRYSNWGVPLEKDALYTKARAHFQDAWNQEMHRLAKKKSMMNFSQTHPMKKTRKNNANASKDRNPAPLSVQLWVLLSARFWRSVMKRSARKKMHYRKNSQKNKITLGSCPCDGCLNLSKMEEKAYEENPNVGKCITNLKRSPGA